MTRHGRSEVRDEPPDWAALVAAVSRVVAVERVDPAEVVELIFALILVRLRAGEVVEIPEFGVFRAVGEVWERDVAFEAAGELARRLGPGEARRGDGGLRGGEGSSVDAGKGVEPDDDDLSTPAPRTPGEPKRQGEVDRPGGVLGEDGALGRESVGEAAPGPDHVEVKVFFATDRRPTGEGEPHRYFGSERSRGGRLHYGTCTVSVPLERRLGTLPGPLFRFRADPVRHVLLTGLDERAEGPFHSRLAERLGQASSRDLLVFIHGYRVTFENAARRTGQLAWDLRWPGVPVLYSWPSRGSFLGYWRDETQVKWSAPHLETFLLDLARRSGADRIHVVAHSMGNRVLVEALERVARAVAAGAAGGPPLHEVILTAPDVDADTFRQLAADLATTGHRLTLYGSKRDRALGYSQGLHGYPRAGDGGEDLVVVPPVESVDASRLDTDVLGHSYYGDSRSVLSDLFYLLRGHAPGDRFGLAPVDGHDGRYWVALE